MDLETRYPVCVSRDKAPPTTLKCDNRVAWEPTPERGGALLPKWRIEPSIQQVTAGALKYCHHASLQSNNLQVERFAGGYFSRCYKLSSVDSHGIQRCAVLGVQAPVMPWYRTQSQVATMQYIRENTRAPIPKVFAFDSSTENPMSFEWVLMEHMEGEPYEKVAKTMTFDERLRLYGELGKYMSDISKHTFDKIGCPYCDWDADPPKYWIGPLIQDPFVSRHRLGYSINRGPFESEIELLEAHFSIIEHELEDTRVPNRPDQEKREQISKILSRHRERLSSARPYIDQSITKWRVVWFDSSGGNILVAGNGSIIALLDWERVAVEEATHKKLVPRFVRHKLDNEHFMNLDNSQQVTLLEAYEEEIKDLKSSSEEALEKMAGDARKTRRNAWHAVVSGFSMTE